MSKTDYTQCSIFLKIAFLFVFIPFSTSAPVNFTENAYTQFIAELNRNKCSVPSQVQLPFDTAKANNFEYLSSYLGICQKTESTKRNKEAVILCKEIFGNIRNISCQTKTALPDINVELSKNVCRDIAARKDSVPEDDNNLLKRLTDGFLCDIMCDSEFEKACQVLLWSFEVQKLIASVANAQEPEQPNDPEDGGEMNDNFKQDNRVDETNPPQSNVDLENEKKNAEEEKNENEVSRMTEQPKLHNLEDNPDAKTIPSRSEKPASSNKEVLLVNQTVPNSVGQDLTGASKTTNSLKTSSTLSEQTLVVSKSNTEFKPLQEITNGISDVQNANKLLQGNNANVPDTKHDDDIVGAGLSQGSNTATYNQTQDVNTLADGDATTLANGHLPDNSKIPDNPNIPLNTNDNSPGNEIPDEKPQKGDQTTNYLTNELPHESRNEEGPNDDADLHNNEQNPSNLDNLAQKKPLTTAINDDKLAQKTNAPTTGSQTDKVTIKQLSTEEVTQDKTSFARDETKADQPQTNSGLTKSETVDHSKTDTILSDDGNANTLTYQKKPTNVQNTDVLDNTIPDTTRAPIADGKLPEKSQKPKATAVNPDGKSVTPTKTTVALEKMEGDGDLHQPGAEEANHYGDLENTEDDEYSRPDYDGGLYEVSKNKESNPDVPITVAKEILTSQNEFPPRNAFGQPDSSDIQMIAAFPEQEDSHFFFYFLSIVLILMAGYLVFHNKQKIIALIVEGRHERNRRSHRIGYKKLETK